MASVDVPQQEIQDRAVATVPAELRRALGLDGEAFRGGPLPQNTEPGSSLG